MQNKILVVAAHPDDEVLGCGATIAKHVASGDEVHILIMAKGVASRCQREQYDDMEKELEVLRTSAHQAAKIMGAASLVLLGLPDNRLDSVDLLDMVKLIELHLEKIKPTVVYTHHGGDLNIDHRRVHEAVVTACRPLPDQSVKTLLFFEVLSSTNWLAPTSSYPFCPNWFVDVSETTVIKLLALKAYAIEMREWPHARSLEAVEALFKIRGATTGVVAAEAFVLGRNIVGAL